MYVGGDPHFMHKSRRDKLTRKHGTAYNHKKVVLGAIQRDGQVRLQIGEIPITKVQLRAFIRAKLADETRVIMTDQHMGYRGIEDENTMHLTVDHNTKEYVRGAVHTNTLENVWSLFKRSIIGSYHQISMKHIDRYLDEFEFRFNNRHNPFLFRDTLLRLLTTEQIEYKELTKEKAA